MHLSNHAQIRVQQRGVNDEALQIVCFASDCRVHLGAQVSAWSLSKQRAQGLRRAGIPDSVISRAERLTLIVGDDGTIVTVLKGAMSHHLRADSNKPTRGGKRGHERERH